MGRQPPDSQQSLRQGLESQPPAILCDEQRLRPPAPPAMASGSSVPSAPLPFESVAQTRELRGRFEAAMAQSNGGWRRRGGRRAQKIPLKGQANQYQQQPGRFKSLSTKPAPVRGHKWQESCLDSPLGASPVAAGGRAWGPGADSQPAGLGAGISCPWGTW